MKKELRPLRVLMKDLWYLGLFGFLKNLLGSGFDPNPSLEMGQWIEDQNFSLYYVVVGLYTTDYIDRWQKIVQLLYTKLQDQGHSRGIVRSF